jgi:hypothetical protein
VPVVGDRAPWLDLCAFRRLKPRATNESRGRESEERQTSGAHVRDRATLADGPGRRTAGTPERRRRRPDDRTRKTARAPAGAGRVRCRLVAPRGATLRRRSDIDEQARRVRYRPGGERRNLCTRCFRRGLVSTAWSWVCDGGEGEPPENDGCAGFVVASPNQRSNHTDDYGRLW